MSKAGYKVQKTRALPKNTTCVVCVGTIGKIYLTSETSFTNQQINSVIVDQEHYDPLYVYCLLRTTIPQVKQLEGGSASGREHVKKSLFEQIEVKVHPLPTQRKIAAILSAYDDLIENNTRRIALLEQTAQLLYREWFVHFRFPGHQSVPLVESELGPIPEGWEVRTLGQFGKVITGKTPSKKIPEYYDNYMPFVKIPDMHGNIFCTRTIDNLSKSGAESQRPKTISPNSLRLPSIWNPSVTKSPATPHLGFDANFSAYMGVSVG
ncbi:MAG: hypothetical protein GY832_10335 [Chloroflexi bacterium]|nr:hypothetical protein [Chloroflexota bacterium]